MSRRQSGLGDAESFGQVDPHLETRRNRLAIQYFGALCAYDRQKLGSQFDPSLATCEQLCDPHAVPDFSKRGLSDPGDGDLLGLVYRLGIEDNDRAVDLALEAKHSADAREALYGALEREDGERREKVVRLLEHGAVGEARRLALCGRQSVRLECPDEFGAAGCGYDENYVPISCGSRLCPDCMDSQIGRKVERYGRVVRRWADPTFYTLTIENVSDAETGTDAVVGAFRRFRRRSIPVDGDGWHWYREGGDEPSTGWKAQLLRAGKHDLVRRLQRKYVNQGKQIPVSELLRGGIYAVDVKQKGSEDWNVHLHVLADAHWIPQAALSAEWADVSGSPVVDVRRIYGRADGSVEDALLETVAYACKAPEFESIEDAVGYMQSMKNRRFVQSFGKTHGNVPDLEGQLLCGRCECTPAWWNYQGIVHDHIDNMGTTHSADSDDPPPEEHGKPPHIER